MPPQTPTIPRSPRGFLQSLRAKRARRVTPADVAAESVRQGLDPSIPVSVTQQESRGFDVTSKAGARGPMQLMPGTAKAIAKRLGEVYNPDDLEQNIRLGVNELKRLHDKYGGDLGKIAIGYNAGESRIGKPMYSETRGWLAGVSKTHAELSAKLQQIADAMDGSPAIATPSATPPQPTQSAPIFAPAPQATPAPTPQATPTLTTPTQEATTATMPAKPLPPTIIKDENGNVVPDSTPPKPILAPYTKDDHPPEIAKTLSEAVENLRHPQNGKISEFQRDVKIGAQPTTGQVMRGTDPTRQDTRISLDAAAIRDAKDVQGAVMDQTAAQLGIKPEEYRQMAKLGILDQTAYTPEQVRQIKDSASYYATVAGDKKLYLPVSAAERTIVEAFKRGGFDAATAARGEMDRQSQAYVDSQHEVTPEERETIEAARQRAGRDAEIGKAVSGELNLARGITNAVGLDGASNYLKSITNPIEQQVQAAKPTLDLRTDTEKIAQGLIFGAPLAAARMMATGAIAAPLGIAGEAGALGAQAYLQNPDAKLNERMKEAVTMAAMPVVSRAASPLIGALAGNGTTAALKEGIGKVGSEAAFNVAQEYVSNPNAEKTDLIRAGILGGAFSAREVLHGLSSAITARQVSGGHLPIESAPDVYQAIITNPEFVKASDAVDQARATIADLQAKAAKNQQQIKAGYMPPFRDVDVQLQQATATHQTAAAQFEAVLKPMLDADKEMVPKVAEPTAAPKAAQSEATPEATTMTADPEADLLTRLTSIAKTGKAPQKLSLDAQKEAFLAHPEAEALFTKLGDDVNTPKGAKEVDKLIQRLKKTDGLSDLVAEDITSEFLTPEQSAKEVADAKVKAEARKEADLKAKASAIQKPGKPEEGTVAAPISDTYEEQSKRLNQWLEDQNKPKDKPLFEQSEKTRANSEETFTPPAPIKSEGLKLDTDLRAKLKNPRWKPFNLESGGRDSTRIASREINLPSKPRPTFTTESTATRTSVPLEKIWLGERSLNREKLLRATENLKAGFKETSDDPVILARDPKNPDNFIVMAGDHRVAALKLMDFNGNIPVTIREAKPAVAPEKPLFTSIARDPEYIAQQQRANERDANQKWQSRAEETSNRSMSDQEKHENVSPIALIRRELGTINPGMLMGEGKHLREGGIHGLLSKKGKSSINDARELLRDWDYRMPDGRSFDEAFDDEVLSFLEDHGTTARPESMADFNNEQKLANEEEAFYRNKEEQSNDRIRNGGTRLDGENARDESVPQDRTETRVETRSQAETPGQRDANEGTATNIEAPRLERDTTEEIRASEPDAQAIERQAPTDAEIDEMARQMLGDRYEPINNALDNFSAEPKYIRAFHRVWQGDFSNDAITKFRKAALDAGFTPLETSNIIQQARTNYRSYQSSARQPRQKAYAERAGLRSTNREAETRRLTDTYGGKFIPAVGDSLAEFTITIEPGKNGKILVKISDEDGVFHRFDTTEADFGGEIAELGLLGVKRQGEAGKPINDAPVRSMSAEELRAENNRLIQSTGSDYENIQQGKYEGDELDAVQTRASSDYARMKEIQTEMESRGILTKPEPREGKHFSKQELARMFYEDLARKKAEAELTSKPVNQQTSLFDQISEQAHEAATSPTNDRPEPTPAQAEAGNYKKGHLQLHGLDISIETPQGSKRSGIDPNGKPWEVAMRAHYGYLKRTTGADAENVDVYIGDHPESEKVFVVDQIDADTKAFDEHKVILGAIDLASAEKLYDAHFDDGKGKDRRGAISEMDILVFKDWLKNGETTKPIALNETKAPVSATKLEEVTHDNAPLIKPEGPLQAKQFTPDEARAKIADLETQLASAKTEMKKLALRDDIAKLQKVITASESDAKQPASEKLVDTKEQRPFDKLSADVEQALRAGKKFDNPAIDRLAEAAFGGKVSEGKYSFKEAYDAVETAVNRLIRERVPELEKLPFPDAIREIETLMDQLPTQDPKRRSKEQQELQQFSTPPTLSYLAAKLLNLRPGEVLLEPSAGTGNLAVVAEGLGARVHANEIDPRRADALRSLGYEVSSEDGEYINNLLSPDIKPTAILMNPPFSATGGRVAQNDSRFGMAHIEQAAARLQKGGRLVAIMGEGTGLNMAKQQKIWQRLADKYTIRAIVPLSGENYRKYGTTFGNVLMVLDKTGPTPGNTFEQQKANVFTPTEFSNYADAYEALTQVRESRTDSAAELRPPTSGDILVTRAPATNVLDQQPTTPSSDSVGSATATSDRDGGMGTVSTRSGADGRSGSRKLSGRINAPEPVRPAGNDDPTQPVESRPVITETPRQAEPVRDDAATAPDRERSRIPTRTNLRDAEQHRAALATRQTVGAYTDYIPQKIVGPGKDPSPYVEPTTLAYVDLPEVNYDLNIPDKGKQTLSLAQYEAAHYIGARHERILPDGSRAGFALGDGTGVGKSYTIAASILDNWNKGTKKIIWLTVNDDRLAPGIHDALRALGAGDIPIKSVKDFGVKAELDHTGILTGSYNVLGKGFNTDASRLPQLMKWLGEDSLIILDEAHKAGNAYVEDLSSVYSEDAQGKLGEGSNTGQAVITLQNTLPKAKVLYATATQAVEPRQMAYMTRLGLWGRGTPFPKFADFQKEIEGQGLSAMEQVVRDLKADGSYMARMLKMAHDPETNTSVEVRQSVHKLDEAQQLAYDTGAKAWRSVLQNIDAALDVTGNARNAKQQAYNAFWANHQRFFSGLMTSFKLPTLVEQARQALDEGRQVVIAVTKTGEAQLNERVKEAERSLLDSQTSYDKNLIPMEGTGNQMANVLKRLVRKSFPTSQYQEVTDENGVKRKVLMTDSEGKPLQNQEAVQMREELINSIDDMFEVVNASSNVTGAMAALDPIDQVIEYFKNQGIEVGEVTGRKSRQIVDDDGRVLAIKRGGANKASLADMNAFQTGKKKVVIINATAAEGYNLHADRRQPSSAARREMIYLEVPWSSIQIAQANGRVNRTNQQTKPINHLIGIDVPGDIRFMATAAKRLASMGAMSSGQRDAVGESSQFAEYDVLNRYGRMTADAMLDALPMSDWEEMGMVKKDSDGAKYLPESIRPEIFFNRVLAMPIEAQNRIVETFLNNYQARVQQAISSGSYDTGVRQIEADNLRRASADKIIAEDENTGAKTHYATFEGERPLYPIRWETIEGLDLTKKAAYFRNKRSGKIYQGEEKYDLGKGWGYTLNSTTVRGYKKIHGDEVNHYQPLTKDEAKTLWNAEVATLPTTKTETFHVLHGKLIGMWDEITNQRKESPSIKQIVTAEGERVIGAVVEKGKVDSILKAFEERSTAADPIEKFAILVRDGDLRLPAGASIGKYRNQGQDYFKIWSVTEAVKKDLVAHPDIPSVYEYSKPQPYIPNDPIKGPKALAALYEIMGMKVKRTAEEALLNRRDEITQRSNAALDRLKRLQGGYVNTDLLVPHFVAVAAERLARGVKSFSQFATEMIEKFSHIKNIRKALRPAWEQAQKFWQDERGELTADLSPLPEQQPQTPGQQKAIGVPAHFQRDDYFTAYAKKAIKAIKNKEFAPDKEAEANDALRAVAEAIYNNDGRALIDARRNLSEMLGTEAPSVKSLKGLKQLGSEVLNLPRTIKASVDFSAPLRQGAIGTLNVLNLQPARARETRENFRKMFTSMGADSYRTFEAELSAHPRAELADQSGLYRATSAEIDFESRLTLREEQYLSRYAGNIPIIKHSERAYKAFLDTQRIQAFDRLATRLEAQGITFENDPRQYKELADFINKSTGRGTIPEMMESFAAIINGLLFSPRYLASRFQLLDPRNYVNAIPGVNLKSTHFYTKEVAREATKEMAGFVAAVGIVTGLMAGAGASVSFNVDDPDFLKPRWGKYRYDLLAGLQQDVRFLWKLAHSFRDNKKDATDVTKHFLRSKLSPVPGYATDVWTGKDFTGKKFSFGRDTVNLIAPLLLHDLYEGFKDQGIVGAAKMLPGTFGIGVQMYEKKETTNGMRLPTRIKTRDGKEEPEAIYNKRVERAKTWFDRYGNRLFSSPRFQNTDDATKKQVQELFHRRVIEEGQLKEPDATRLAPEAIWESIRQSKEQKQGARGKPQLWAH